MTDKQIIIDGIDVSGCWYIDRDNAWCDLCMTSCVKGTKHCYYKQLKRKEQECEELKTKLINWLGKEGIRQSEKEFYEQHLEAYKMEAEEGKEINAELKAENDLFRTCHDNEQAKRRKYEQTLAEIKPILELYANSKVGEEQPDRTYKIILSGGYIMAYDPRPAREGLKKISECEV